MMLKKNVLLLSKRSIVAVHSVGSISIVNSKTVYMDALVFFIQFDLFTINFLSQFNYLVIAIEISDIINIKRSVAKLHNEVSPRVEGEVQYNKQDQCSMGEGEMKQLEEEEGA